MENKTKRYEVRESAKGDGVKPYLAQNPRIRIIIKGEPRETFVLAGILYKKIFVNRELLIEVYYNGAIRQSIMVWKVAKNENADRNIT